MKLTQKIQVELTKFVCSHANDIIIPNFYFSGYEMDLMRISRTGAISEYEIKVSRADFLNDFQKGKTVYNLMSTNWRSTSIITKHSLLAEKKTKVARFWFVVPEGLIKPEEIPAHAGLLYYERLQNKFEVIKTAPLLARGPQEIDFKKICMTLAQREINLKAKLLKQLNQKPKYGKV